MKPHSKHKPIVPGPSFSAGVHVAASTTTMTALIDTDRKRLDQLYHRCASGPGREQWMGSVVTHYNLLLCCVKRRSARWKLHHG